MMKSLLNQQQNPGVEENMSNLTSASGEASGGSSGNRVETTAGSIAFPQQQYFAPNQTQPAVKKKRNQPGNPDPDAEVIALSPKTLMATNRFVCEICNKGFQRDQNLQLHRRGHNLPWKLKQRTSKEIRKKVYVCPEPSCVHHEPSRALGDLTGIKKHFCRKHGEKRWKCEKCSKRYAVQSDWKAHSKTCGTKEYRCDCGTLFSRRDSFITHRAFCDGLAEESARAVTVGGSGRNNINPLIISSSQSVGPSIPHNMNPQIPFQTQFHPQDIHPSSFPMKKEQQESFMNNVPMRPEMPSWLACPPVVGTGPGPPTFFSSTRPLDQQHQDFDQNPSPNNPSSSLGGPTTATPLLQPYHHQPMASPHMSATALLQKAALMGATMSTRNCASPGTVGGPHNGPPGGHHVSAAAADSVGGFGLNLSSREEMGRGFFAAAPFGSNKAANLSGTETGSGTSGAGAPHPPSSSFLQEMISLSTSATGFAGSSFEDTFGGGGGGGDGRRGDEGMTRDFLGLRPLSDSDILSIAGLSSQVNSQVDRKYQT